MRPGQRVQRGQNGGSAGAVEQICHQLIQRHRFAANNQPVQQRLFQGRRPADLLFQQLADPFEKQRPLGQKGDDVAVKDGPDRLGHQLEGQWVAAVPPGQRRGIPRGAGQGLVGQQRPAGVFRQAGYPQGAHRGVGAFQRGQFAEPFTTGQD